MLAAQLEDHDTVGQWMAHHLAELVVAAQDNATITVEQRQQIVDMILKVWTHRRYFPGRGPLEEFSSVFVALDRLGDDGPWKFSRLFNTDTEMPDARISGLPLVATATELERLTRETLVHLLWLAAQDAKEQNQEWLDAADKIASNLESEVATRLSRLHRRVAHRRIRAVQGDPRDVAESASEIPAEEDDANSKAGDATERRKKVAADDIVENGNEEPAEPFGHDDREDNDLNPLSDISHAKRLRAMAGLLNKVAEALTDPRPAD